MTRPAHCRRLVALAGTVAVLASLLVAPATAAQPPGAARAAGHVEIRGAIAARQAARAARGIVRPVSALAPLQRELNAGRAPSVRPRGASVRPRGPLLIPVQAQVIEGIGDVRDGLDVQPPDPWVAASSTHLVQSTNGMVRMYNRAGTTLLSLPTWALWGLAPDELDADPRIIWDSQHARWVGVLLSWVDDGLGGALYSYLNLAVSDGADPTGTWQVFSFGYEDTVGATTFPDYPGISSSSDKVVLTANEFTADMGTFVGASVLVVTWSDLLTGVAPAPPVWTYAEDYASYFAIRPAIIQRGPSSPAVSDIHLVAEGAAGDIVWAKLSGTGTAEPVFQPISGIASVPGFSDPLDVVDPTQPGGDTLTEGVDERPTDAVYRDGRLALVSTWGDGADNSVRVTVFNAAVNPPAFAGGDDDRYIGNPGTSCFHGGIGFSGDGTLFTSYTCSSPVQYLSTYAAAYRAGAWSAPALIHEGTAVYASERWGDYVGVALDPAGTAAVWQSNAIADASGSWVTQVSRLVLDTTPPIVSAPNQGLVTGTTLGRYTVPVRVSWTASDPGSGVAASLLQANQWSSGLYPSGSFTGVSTVRNHYWKWYSDTNTDASMAYAVTGVDAYGTASGAMTGSSLSPLVYEETNSATYTGTWGTSSSTSFNDGKAKYSSTAGATVTFRAYGRAFGFVTYRASNRGKVKVYLDGVYKTTLTLTSSTLKTHNLAYVTNFATSGTHSIKLVVVSGRVDVDAFVVLK
jgi:hypothetical protein